MELFRASHQALEDSRFREDIFHLLELFYWGFWECEWDWNLFNGDVIIIIVIIRRYIEYMNFIPRRFFVFFINKWKMKNRSIIPPQEQMRVKNLHLFIQHFPHENGAYWYKVETFYIAWHDWIWLDLIVIELFIYFRVTFDDDDDEYT